MVDLLMVGDRGGRLRPVLGNAINDFTLSDLSCKQLCSHAVMTLWTHLVEKQICNILQRKGTLAHANQHLVESC
jgi:hypothetical protein